MRMDTKLGTALATAKASLCKFSASMSMQPKTNHYTTRSFSWPQQLPPQSLFRHLSSPSSASISASLSCWFHGADERCHEVRPSRARADLGIGRVRKGRKAGKKGTRAIKGESASSCVVSLQTGILVFWRATVEFVILSQGGSRLEWWMPAYTCNGGSRTRQKANILCCVCAESGRWDACFRDFGLDWRETRGLHHSRAKR